MGAGLSKENHPNRIVIAYVAIGILTIVGGALFSRTAEVVHEPVRETCTVISANDTAVRCMGGYSAVIYGEPPPVTGDRVVVYNHGNGFKSLGGATREMTVKSAAILTVSIIVGWISIMCAFAAGISGRNPLRRRTGL